MCKGVSNRYRRIMGERYGKDKKKYHSSTIMITLCNALFHLNNWSFRVDLF